MFNIVYTLGDPQPNEIDIIFVLAKYACHPECLLT